METTTIQKFIHTSPRKLRLVADMVRSLQPKKALDILQFSPKAAAKDLTSAIKAALASAKGAGVKEDKANFKKIEVNEGPKMRRFRAGARGRAKPYRRKMSHIKIVLTDNFKLKTENLKLKTKLKEGGVTESSKT